MKNLLIQIILGAVIIILISGCTTQSKCYRKFPAQTMVITKDSIIRTTETIYRDTIIYIYVKGETKYSTDTVYIKNGLSYSNKNHLHTSFADSWAWVANGRLYHELIQKDTLIGQEVKDAVRLTWERAERFYNKSELKVKTERFIPKWAWWCLGISIASLLYIGFKAARFFKLF
jgi:hypothetical protein